MKEFFLCENFKIEEISNNRFLVCIYNDTKGIWCSPAVIDIAKYSLVYEFRLCFSPSGYYAQSSNELNNLFYREFKINLSQDFIEYIDSLMVSVKLTGNLI